MLQTQCVEFDSKNELKKHDCESNFFPVILIGNQKVNFEK